MFNLARRIFLSCIFVLVILLNLFYFSPKILNKIAEKIQCLKQGKVIAGSTAINKAEYFNKIRHVSLYELEHPYIPLHTKGKLLELLKGGFFYSTALLANSVIESHRQYGNKDDLSALIKFYDKYIDAEGGFMKLSNIEYVDNVTHGNAILYLYQVTKENKYLNASKYLASFVKKSAKAANGIIPYRSNRPSVILVDTLAMVCPFLAQYGNIFNDVESVKLAESQMINFIDNGVDSVTGLPYHGYILGRKGYVGILGWSRGTGWFLYGLVGTLEQVSSDSPSKEKMLLALRKVAETLESYQKIDGAWSWDTIESDAQSEMSGTALIAYCIEKAIRLGFLPKKYYEMCDKAACALIKNTTDKGYLMQASGDCEGTGRYSIDYGHYSWAQGSATAFFLLYLSRNNTEEKL